MSRTSAISTSQETVCSSRNASAHSFNRTVVVVDHEQQNDSLFTWLCAKVWCRSGRNDDDVVHKQSEVSSCSLLCIKHMCCGRSDLPALSAEVRRRDMELRDCRTIDHSTVVRRSVNTAAQCRGQCLLSDGAVRLQDNTVVHEEKHGHFADIVPHTSGTNTDSVARRKPPAAHCVMLADAAYGHATAIDDCLMSDSEGWSWRSLSNSRPNSTEAAGLGGMASAAAADGGIDDIYESYSGDEDDEDETWQAVIAVPVPPVYDQVLNKKLLP